VPIVGLFVFRSVTLSHVLQTVTAPSAVVDGFTNRFYQPSDEQTACWPSIVPKIQAPVDCVDDRNGATQRLKVLVGLYGK